MQTDELKNLAADVAKLKCESQTIECKEASQGCPTRLFNTLSSFSNQDSGGIILFGISENDRFR
ncbi:MAG: ATP-binding protein [Bacillota bacterium]|nr:ATP-binding protein [Bacillota bacterium]